MCRASNAILEKRMKTLGAILLLLVVLVAQGDDGWTTVNEGFSMSVPKNWKRQKVQPIDSNCGTYRANTADLEFDEVYGLGYTKEKSQSAIEKLKQKEADPKLLKPGEEVWHVDGRIAHFISEKVDPQQYGKRRFSNVASLHVPYDGQPGYLEIYIFYKTDKDLPTVRKVLQSVKWKAKTTDRQDKPSK
jgi:hypothetical protein